MKVMISLDKKFLENNKEEAMRKYNNLFDDIEANSGYCFEFETKNDEGINLIDSEGEIQLSGALIDKKDISSSIYFKVAEKPSTSDLIKISEMIVKNFNKVKSFFETMK